MYLKNILKPNLGKLPIINLNGLAAAMFDREQMKELSISPIIIQIAKGNLCTYRSHRTKLLPRLMPHGHPWAGAHMISGTAITAKIICLQLNW